MSSAAEAAFRVQAPNSMPRTIKVIGLDAASEDVVRRLAASSWNQATFYTAATFTRNLRDEVATADLVVMVATPGGGASAASLIGEACSQRRVMTTACRRGDRSVGQRAGENAGAAAALVADGRHRATPTITSRTCSARCGHSQIGARSQHLRHCRGGRRSRRYLRRHRRQANRIPRCARCAAHRRALRALREAPAVEGRAARQGPAARCADRRAARDRRPRRRVADRRGMRGHRPRRAHGGPAGRPPPALRRTGARDWIRRPRHSSTAARHAARSLPSHAGGCGCAQGGAAAAAATSSLSAAAS